MSPFNKAKAKVFVFFQPQSPLMNEQDNLFSLKVVWEWPLCLFPLWPDVSHHTGPRWRVLRRPRVSGPGPERNAAGWKAASGAAETQVCQSV